MLYTIFFCCRKRWNGHTHVIPQKYPNKESPKFDLSFMKWLLKVLKLIWDMQLIKVLNQNESFNREKTVKNGSKLQFLKKLEQAFSFLSAKLVQWFSKLWYLRHKSSPYDDGLNCV